MLSKSKMWQQIRAWSPGPVRGTRQRWLVPAIALGSLAVIAFFSVTNPAYLPHDHLLNGADWMGAGICHRLVPRSFVINGRPLPLCARCTGIYLGVALVFLVLGVAGRWRRGELPRLPVLLVLVGFIGVMGLDGINSYTHFFPNFPHVYAPRNWLRLLTGMGAGLAMGLLIFPALMQTLWRVQDSTPIIDSFGELAGIMLLAGSVIVLALSNQPVILYVLAIVSVVGTLLILAAINAVLLLIVLRRDGVAANWRETALPLTTGLMLAVGELATIAWLRLSLTGTITGFPGL